MALSLFLGKCFAEGELISDQIGSSNRADILTINAAKKLVVWYCSSGNKTLRTLTFQASPLSAIFCSFQGREHVNSHSANRNIQNAIAVLTSDSDLHIHMFSHETYQIRLPHPMKNMVATPNGLLFQRKGDADGYELENLLRNALNMPSDLNITRHEYFSLANPSSPLVPVRRFDSCNGTSILNPETLPSDCHIACMHEDIMIQYSESTDRAFVWQIAKTSAVDIPIRHHDKPTAEEIDDLMKPVFSAEVEAALDNIDSATQFAGIMPLKNDAFPFPRLRANSADSSDEIDHIRPVRHSGRFSLQRENSEQNSRFSMRRENSDQGARLSTSPIPTATGSRLSPTSMSNSSHNMMDNALYREATLLPPSGAVGGVSASLMNRRRSNEGFGRLSFGDTTTHGIGSLEYQGPVQKDVSLRPYQLSVTPTTLMEGAGFRQNHSSSGDRRMSLSSVREDSLNLSMSRVLSSPITKMDLSSNASFSFTHTDKNSRHSMDMRDVSMNLSNVSADTAAGFQETSSEGVHTEMDLHLIHVLQLPFTAKGKHAFTISGHAQQVGGLVLTCHNQTLGTVTLYSMSRKAKENGLYELVLSPIENHSLQNQAFVAVAHCSIPLEDCRRFFNSYQGKLLMGCRETLIPLTFLLHKQTKPTVAATSVITVMLGSVVINEMPLQWTDDMDDIDISVDSGEDSSKRVDSITTVQKDCNHFVVTRQGKQMVLSTQSCLFATREHVNIHADFAKALIGCRLTLPSGVVEKTLGLLSQIEYEVRSDGAVFVLLCSAFDISSETCMEVAKTENLLNITTLSDQLSTRLNQFYTTFQSFCKEHHNANVPTVLYQSYQSVLQDFILREGEEGVASVRSVNCLKRCLDVLDTVRGNTLSPPSSTVMTWYKTCITSLIGKIESHNKMDETALESVMSYSIPPALNTLSLHPFPTLRLTQGFFSYLHELPSYSGLFWSRVTLDAIVHSIHNTHSDSETVDLDWTTIVSYFPSQLQILAHLAIDQCRNDANPKWPDYVLKVIGRQDLFAKPQVVPKPVKHTPILPQVKHSKTQTQQKSSEETIEVAVSDGLAEVESSSRERFPKDERMREVCRMLRSSASIYVRLEKSPETSDMDHRAKLQYKLLIYCRRSLAGPIGRGMLTMSSLEPLVAEVLPIPPLSLTGRVAPDNTTLALDMSTAHEHMTLWPEFHNGVAAALRIGSVVDDDDTKENVVNGGKKRPKITRNWIIYNRTASQAVAGGEASHAGFLFGLGIQGHLTTLSVTDICDYLVQGQEAVTIAILLGCATSKIGSADPILSKSICLHLPALLPAHHWDIEVAPLIQTAALISMGVLHCGSGHRVMIEFFLAELSRKPSSDRCETREAMTLAACWSLGMVLLNRGEKSTDEVSDSTGQKARRHAGSGLAGLMDMQIEDRLLRHMHGGKRPAESALFPSHHTNVDISSRSSRVLEGNEINVDITAPGATIALALIYMRSNNKDILGHMDLPDTLHILSSIRPDLLLYRAMAKCLIMWEEIEPSEKWLDSNIPQKVHDAVFAPKVSALDPEAEKAQKIKDLFAAYHKTAKKNATSGLEPKTALALYLNIITGYCWGIGLIYAGTFNEEAKKTIFAKLQFLQSLRDNKVKAKLTVTMDKSLRNTVEMCLSVVSISLSCVMAGSGDLDCLRILRELKFKVEDVPYGSHVALSMAIGMLFLAGGHASLRRDPLSTACLLISMCPRFPARTIDHQYHLQPLRHFYVLATEYRSLHIVDVDSGEHVELPVEVELLSGKTIIVKASGLLPELATVRKIHMTKETQQYMAKLAKSEGKPIPPEYYPVSITLNDESSVQDATADVFKQRGFRMSFHKQIHVPTLYVKKVYQKWFDMNENPVLEEIPDDVPLIRKKTDKDPTVLQEITKTFASTLFKQPSLTFTEDLNQLSRLLSQSSTHILQEEKRKCLIEEFLSFLREVYDEEKDKDKKQEGKQEFSNKAHIGNALLHCEPFLTIVSDALKG